MEKWINTEERLPELGEKVLCYQPPKAGYMTDQTWDERILIGYMFRLARNERSGFIDKELVGDKGCHLSVGGFFWAFPYICHQNGVTHWMPLPDPPQK